MFDGIDRDGGIGTATTSGFGRTANEGGGGNAGVGGGGGGFGGFGGLGGFGNLFGQGGLGGSGTTQPTIRVRLRSAVEVDPIPQQVIQQNANSRIVRLPRQRLSNVNVTVVDRTAVINGTVTSEKDRRMSELLMRLEPGVRSVQNNVIVQP